MAAGIRPLMPYLPAIEIAIFSPEIWKENPFLIAVLWCQFDIGFAAGDISSKKVVVLIGNISGYQVAAVFQGINISTRRADDNVVVG